MFMELIDHRVTYGHWKVKGLGSVSCALFIFQGVGKTSFFSLCVSVSYWSYWGVTGEIV